MLDYHIHTKLCGHATGEPEEYVQAALAAGLEELGFTDHIPMYFREPLPGFAMQETELADYVQAVTRLQQLYPQITIRLGIEADYFPGQEQRLAALLKQYAWDYVLGSVHFIGEWGFDDERQIAVYQQWELGALYQHYFDLVQRAAKSGYFQVMAHPDLIKKFGYRPEEPMTKLYEQTVKVFRDAGVCAEVNTAGWRVKVQEIYPHPEFLEMCCHYRVPVTLGSDAHCPKLVGQGLREAAVLLRDIGFKQIATFQGRKLALRALDF